MFLSSTMVAVSGMKMLGKCWYWQRNQLINNSASDYPSWAWENKTGLKKAHWQGFNYDFNNEARINLSLPVHQLPPSCCFPRPDGEALGKQCESRWGSMVMSVPSVSTASAWHLGRTRGSLTLLSLSESRWSGSDSQFVILRSLWLGPCLFCTLRSATQSHGRVNNTVWFQLSTDCSWNVLWLSGNRLVLRFQYADAREFPSTHLPRQWVMLVQLQEPQPSWIVVGFLLYPPPQQIGKDVSRNKKRK